MDNTPDTEIEMFGSKYNALLLDGLSSKKSYVRLAQTPDRKIHIALSPKIGRTGPYIVLVGSTLRIAYTEYFDGSPEAFQKLELASNQKEDASDFVEKINALKTAFKLNKSVAWPAEHPVRISTVGVLAVWATSTQPEVLAGKELVKIVNRVLKSVHGIIEFPSENSFMVRSALTTGYQNLIAAKGTALFDFPANARPGDIAGITGITELSAKTDTPESTDVQGTE